jgi:hypothetical protein
VSQALQLSPAYHLGGLKRALRIEILRTATHEQRLGDVPIGPVTGPDFEERFRARRLRFSIHGGTKILTVDSEQQRQSSPWSIAIA